MGCCAVACSMQKTHELRIKEKDGAFIWTVLVRGKQRGVAITDAKETAGALGWLSDFRASPWDLYEVSESELSVITKLDFERLSARDAVNVFTFNKRGNSFNVIVSANDLQRVISYIYQANDERRLANAAPQPVFGL